MDKINEMTNWLLLLIPIGGAARILYCLAAIPVDDDARDSYRKRIRNILKAITYYYGG